MSAIVNDIFRLTSSGYSARATLKANLSLPIQSNPTTPAKGEDMDKVTLSRLAQSLKGVENTDADKKTLSRLFKDETAQLFNSLNKQDQDQLQSLYASGAASAREIELTLQAEANSAISSRAARERPRSAEEVAAGKEWSELSKLSDEYAHAAKAAFELESDGISQFEQGLIGEDQLQAIKDDAAKQKAELDSQDKYKNISERANQAFENNIKMSMSGLKDFLGGPSVTEEQSSARSKLHALGFGGPAVNRSLNTYAQQRDSLSLIR